MMMESELSPEHEQYFRAIFEEFVENRENRENRDGVMTKQELRVVMAALGENMSEGMIDELVGQIDQDSNGCVDCDEFLHLMEIIMRRPDPQVEFKRAFGTFDRDGNGSISSGELKQVMINLEQELTNSELEEIYRRVGKDEMDEEEFVRLLMTSEL